MDRHDCPRRPARSNRLAPRIETLEGRQLPSVIGTYSSQVAYQAQVVRHEYDQYVGELKRLELASRATPAEYLSLRDDARAISEAASPGDLTRSVAQLKAVAASIEIDRAPLYGWLGEAGWDGVASRLGSDLDGLGVPAPLVDRTVADMRALAASADVEPDGFATFSDDFTTLRNGEQTLPSGSGYHFEDPSLFYTQHLRGFFRGWGVEKVGARATLDRDLAAIRRQAGTDPADEAVLDRDVRILEGLGAAVPSTTMDSFNAAYAAAFAPGTPTPSALGSLRSSLVGILGPAATSTRVASVDRLVADATAFDQAVGGSATAVQTIVADVGALVDSGGGEALNPFKITIQPGGAAGPGG